MYIGICILVIVLGCVLFYKPSILHNCKIETQKSKMVIIRVFAVVLIIIGVLFLYYLYVNKVTLPLSISKAIFRIKA